MGLKSSRGSWIPPFILGVTAMGGQIILMREFCVHFTGNELSYGVLLAFWLLAVGIGSLTAERLGRMDSVLAPWYAVILLLPACALIFLRFSRLLTGFAPGEETGLGTILLAALLFCFLAGMPLGWVFVLNIKKAGGDISRVYFFESLGAAAGGALVHFALVPLFSNWQAYALLAGGAGLIFSFAWDRRLKAIFWIPAALFLVIMALGDFTAQKIAWSPYRLTAALDTRYGKLQIIRQGEQVSLYNSGRKSYTRPDPASDEEAAHFALLQIPGARQVLIIGGGGGGVIEEILKYPDTRITWIDIDPQAFPFWRAHLPEEAGRIEKNPRVRLVHTDGRDYLGKTKTRYDAVIVNLGDPESARLNRFYTLEFFRLIRSRLNREGIFSFRTSGAEAYIGPAREKYLASLFKTLGDVFPHAAVVPGENWIFLAGGSHLVLDPQKLTERIEEFGLKTRYVAPGFLFNRLNPLRQEQIDSFLRPSSAPFNLDRRPIGYLLTIRLWAERSRSPAAALFQAAARADLWLLVVPLLAWAGLLPVLLIRRLRNAGVLLAAPMFTLGVSTMVAEVLVLMAYQTSHGSLYGDLSALLTAFMLGLAGGAAYGRRARASFRELVVLQSVLLAMMVLLRMAIARSFPFGEAAAFLLLLGAVNGRLFLAANRLYLKSGSRYGLGYGLDLIGSFAGALGAATLLIPLFGYFPVAEALILLNGMTVLALAAAGRFR